MEIAQLTFLRFIAASGVIIFHFGTTASSLQWGNAVWMRANTAVSFFFLLSGFILAHVYSRGGIRRRSDFYVARLARIVPLYWLALLAMSLYRWHKQLFHGPEFVASFVLVQAWRPGWSQVLNAPGWSLSVEVLFYLCFPFLLAAMVRLRSLTLVGLSGVLWASNLAVHIALSRAAHAGEHPLLHDFTVYHPLVHIATFVTGIALGLLFGRHRERWRSVARPMVVSSLVLFFAMILIPNRLLEYHHNGLFAPVFGLFIIGLSAAPKLFLSRLFSVGPLVLLGEASYGMYILQLPVFLAWTPIAQKLALSANALFWCYYLILVLTSVACFKYVEGPARRWIKDRFRAIPVVVPAIIAVPAKENAPS